MEFPGVHPSSHECSYPHLIPVHEHHKMVIHTYIHTYMLRTARPSKLVYRCCGGGGVSDGGGGGAQGGVV